MSQPQPGDKVRVTVTRDSVVQPDGYFWGQKLARSRHGKVEIIDRAQDGHRIGDVICVKDTGQCWVRDDQAWRALFDDDYLAPDDDEITRAITAGEATRIGNTLDLAARAGRCD